MVYDEAAGRGGSRHLSELRDTLAPPLARPQRPAGPFSARRGRRFSGYDPAAGV
jgi:hypothetical protein